MATPAQGLPAPTTAAVDGEDDLLVSEFPPPPPYYVRALTLKPPPIPHDCFARAAKHSAATAAKTKRETEMARREATQTQTQLGGVGGDAVQGGEANNALTEEPVPVDEEVKELQEGDVVAVFGEIVEDPLLVHIEDDYNDPNEIRDIMSRLNRDVMEGFVSLVNELVNKPLDNKKCRDEVSHNLFLMIQECNKFREHQSREILIEMLESHLKIRQDALSNLKSEVEKATKAIEMTKLANS
eukprot:CAMPEP_0194377786 /NCGR_PEP_ID=MMETSP0174-20130528/32336_1 /TAXON_ID=216777 /ORGANISM="Proboscia alata, Strain PI-D3" /LENGTH=240 /DNA_ID=CAMNT_0039159377 /DNA_START=19 /DNA_END=741 /DNA_ORIENTATION=+